MHHVSSLIQLGLLPDTCHCLQDWLTSIEMKYYESKVNLNWKNILKSIKEVSADKINPYGLPSAKE